MSENYKLKKLKAEEQAAYQRKQAAYAEYSEAVDYTAEAESLLNLAWNKCQEARDTLDYEYEKMRKDNDHYLEVWEEFERIRGQKKLLITPLEKASQAEHQKMKECFAQASKEYRGGSKAKASKYSNRGKKHKRQRDVANKEMALLNQEISEARADAKRRAPGTDSTAFWKAKEALEVANGRHKEALYWYNRAKAECERLRGKFEVAEAEHLHLKERYMRKLAKLKADNKNNRRRILEAVGVPLEYRETAKIVKKRDGKTHIYSGGIGGGDGLGHGHMVLDSEGKKLYDRPPIKLCQEVGYGKRVQNGMQEYRDDFALHDTLNDCDTLKTRDVLNDYDALKTRDNLNANNDIYDNQARYWKKQKYYDKHTYGAKGCNNRGYDGKNGRNCDSKSGRNYSGYSSKYGAAKRQIIS